MEAGLLERQDELQRLDTVVGDVGSGAGRVVLIAGEPGIGKSALLGALGAGAEEAGLEVLRGAGAALERDFGYGVVRQLLERPLARARSRRPRAGLRGGRRPGRTGLRAPVADAPAIAEGDPALVIRHALVRLVDALAAPRPLALLVDDLHWADGASVRWLAYLARRVAQMPVLVAAALRPGECDDPAIGDLLELGMVIRPRALSADAVAELAAQRFGVVAHRFSSACHELTGGNPLLLDDLLRAAREEGLDADAAAMGRLEQLGAQRVADRVGRRLARVSAAARELVAAVAVLGSADLHRAAALAALDQPAALQAAGELERAGLLGPGHPLRIVHPLLQAAIAADLPALRRGDLHRRAATVLADDPARADEAATHLLQSPPAADPWVVARLVEAGDRALARGAPDAAFAMFERALAEPPGPARFRVLARLGRSASRAGRHADAVRHLREATPMAPPAEREGLARDLGVSLVFENRALEGAALLEAAIAELPESDADRRAARLRLESDLAMVAITHEELTVPGLERVRRVAAGLRGSTPAERALLAMACYRECWLASATAREVADALERVVAHGDLLDDEIRGSVAATWAALVFWHADRPQRAFDMLDEGDEYARRRGASPLLALTLVTKSRLLVSVGALEAARQAAMDVDAFDLLATMQLGQASHLGALVSATLAQGLVGEAGALLDSRPPDGYITPVGTFHLARMAVRSAQGRHDEAVADARELLRRLAVRRHAGLRLVDGAADVLLAAGRVEEAVAVARDGLEVALRWGAPSAIAPLRRILGLALDDERQLRCAADLVDPGPFRLEACRSLLALGAHLRRTRRRAQAREPLRRALDLASRMGARQLEATAQTELRACGARPRSVLLTGVESLTPSERRVADLVARGHSNRQVAQALFVERSTVETHLRSVYRKLGVAGREQLGGLLGDAEHP